MRALSMPPNRTTHTRPGDGPESLSEVLARIFADIGEGVIVADEHRRILVANRAAVALFGYAADADMVGRSTRLLYESDADYERQGRTHYNIGVRAAPSSFLVRYRRADGSHFDAETFGGPVRDPATGDILYLGFIRDVSARFSAEKALYGLHEIAANQNLDFNQRRRAILELGCEYFGLEVGLIGRIEGADFTVVEAVDPGGAVRPGDVYPVSADCDRHALAQDAPLFTDGTRREPNRCHPAFRDAPLSAYIGCRITVGEECYGTIDFCSREEAPVYGRSDLDLISMFAQWIGQEICMQRNIEALQRAHDHLSRVATIDEVTGLGNRRLLVQQLDHEIERGRRTGQPLSLALVDIDRFKRFNDTRGHGAGDRALGHFAELARTGLRSSDLVGRWGGDEFLLLLPDTPRAGAIGTLERFFARLRMTPVPVDGADVYLSASAGVTESDCQETAKAILERADRALYRAKAAGRDRIEYV